MSLCAYRVSPQVKNAITNYLHSGSVWRSGNLVLHRLAASPHQQRLWPRGPRHVRSHSARPAALLPSETPVRRCSGLCPVCTWAAFSSLTKAGIASLSLALTSSVLIATSAVTACIRCIRENNHSFRFERCWEQPALYRIGNDNSKTTNQVVSLPVSCSNQPLDLWYPVFICKSYVTRSRTCSACVNTFCLSNWRISAFFWEKFKQWYWK